MRARACLTMRWMSPVILCLVVTVVPVAQPAGAGELGLAGMEHFEKEIRPVLVSECIRCHGPDKQQGGLRLDSRAGWTKGGDSGPAILPNDPDASLLIEAIRYEGFEMPPRGMLSDETVAAFEAWIRQGAPDPRDGTEVADEAASPSVEQGRQFWAFQPVSHWEVPRTERSDWSSSIIDAFVLAKLEEAGLEPNEPADPVALVRRAYFDLTGLPPTPAQIDAFLADESDMALANLIDRLLQTPAFGEQWGRHWLDVVRFAESSGGGRSLLFPDAWRYRDYVIESFNDDVPYDQFVREQLAGDLLDAEDWIQRRRQLVATGFLLLGPTNYELQDKDVLEMDVVDEQLDTIGKSILGMTIGCARCHDHKFDPIPMHDYYAMAGILKSTRAMIHSNVSQWNTAPLPPSPKEAAEIAAYEKKLAAAQADFEAAKKAWIQAGGNPDENEKKSEGQKKDAVDAQDTTSAYQEELARLEKKMQARKATLGKIKKAAPRREIAMVCDDDADAGDIRLAIRGVVHNEGPMVPRGVLQVASHQPFAEIPETQSGRKELADWMASVEHPLTARVIVNRVWYWLFGQGLVPTVDNFGQMGESPSHPELLDHLAASFVDDGWSIKRLIRRVMLSRVYQLSSQTDSEKLAVDPNNRLLWRMNRRRLRAEEMRDSMLVVSGQLDPARGGTNVKPGTKSEYGYTFDSTRRSVYLPVFRNALPEWFEVFDFPDPNIQKGSRTSSTVASQALLMMNHPSVIERSRQAARRLLEKEGTGTGQRIEYAYRHVLGRLPTADERAVASQFIQAGDTPETRWAMFYQTLFQSVDFRFLN